DRHRLVGERVRARGVRPARAIARGAIPDARCPRRRGVRVGARPVSRARRELLGARAVCRREWPLARDVRYRGPRARALVLGLDASWSDLADDRRCPELPQWRSVGRLLALMATRPEATWLLHAPGTLHVAITAIVIEIQAPARYVHAGRTVSQRWPAAPGRPAARPLGDGRLHRRVTRARQVAIVGPTR